MDLLRPNMDAAYAAKSVAYTGTAGTTGAFPPGPQGVLVWSTTDCYVKVTVDASVATANDLPLPAYTPVLIHVPISAGLPWKVSAIQISAGGTIYAKPVNKE